ncbi:hypothetical protein SGRIM128S_04883 [Streptomyces griseomycini]
MDGGGRRCPVRAALVAVGRRVVVGGDVEDRDGDVRREFGAAVGEQEGGARVVEDEADACQGCAGCERDVAGTGPEDREERHDEVGGAVHGHRDQAFGAGAPGAQQPGETAGEGVEVAVGEFGVPEDERGRVRTLRHARREQPRHGVRPGGRAVGAVSLGQEERALGRGEDVQGGDRPPRVVGSGGQEADETVGDAPGGVGGVQVGGMAEDAGDAGRPAVGVVPFGEVEGEVDLVAGDPAGRHHVRDEPPVARAVLACHDRRVPDTFLLAEDRLDLARLDAEAAHLHLVVDTPGELQLPVGRPARQVAGAVHALTGQPVRRRERVRHEALGGRARAVGVPARDARARQVQLPHRAGRHEAEGSVQDVGARAVQRTAERHLVRDPVARGERPAGGEGRRLGRPVPGDDGGAGARVQHRAQRLGRHPLAARPHLPEPRETARRLLGEDPQQAGRQEHPGQPVPGDQFLDAGRGQGTGRCHDDPAAVEERHPHLVRGRVEGVGGVQQDPLVRVAAQLRVGREGDHVPVRDGDALGHARRARGVDHVREGVRVGGRGVAACGGRAEDARCPRVGEQDARAGVGQDEAASFLGPEGVERHVGGAGPHHGEERHHEVGRAVHRDGHPALRLAPHATSPRASSADRASSSR